MLTLFLQSGLSIILLLFGSMALVIARRGTTCSDPIRAAWFLTGVTFVIFSLHHSIQNVGAMWAFLAGPDTVVYSRYLMWAPVGNHSRTFLGVAFHGALVILVSRSKAPTRRFWTLTFVAFFSAMCLGGLFGWTERLREFEAHYSATALLDIVGLVLLLWALFVASVKGTMDRLHWLCIATYALMLVLGVLWHTALVWIRVPGAWAPSPLHMHVYRVVLGGVMVAVAAYRIGLANRGVYVPGLFEIPARSRFPTFG